MALVVLDAGHGKMERRPKEFGRARGDYGKR